MKEVEKLKFYEFIIQLFHGFQYVVFVYINIFQSFLGFCSFYSRYDFFIVSQAVRNGCVSPTHYNVIYDTGKLKPDHLQRLTYKLCHMYYNWSVSISW